MKNIFLAGVLLLIPVLQPSTAWCAPLEKARFVQLCDTQLGMGGSEADKIRFDLAVKAINLLAVDWVVICGDLVNDGTDDKAVTDFKAIAKSFNMPVYLAPGNHDVGNEPTVETLERYRTLQGPDYYTVIEHGLKVMIVNTQLWKAPVHGESDKHDAWFRSELESARSLGTPTLIVSHYPPFVASLDEPEAYFNLPPDKRKELLAQMKSSGVIAWLAGHVHKNLELDYQGMPVVASATTSKNFDQAPYGFRVWKINQDNSLENRYVPLDIPEGAIPEAEAPSK